MGNDYTRYAGRLFKFKHERSEYSRSTLTWKASIHHEKQQLRKRKKTIATHEIFELVYSRLAFLYVINTLLTPFVKMVLHVINLRKHHSWHVALHLLFFLFGMLGLKYF